MSFDNKQFGRGVHDTIKDMDSLKKSLDMTATTKGLENLEKGSKNVRLDGIASSLETISSKFNALGVVAFTIFQNMTNDALSAGKRIVSAFTLDPIKMGFQEYETQINAVQTILANTSSKGTNLKQVSAALDELNTYADKTIYNFTEMTRNIGTFTAAGVDLDVSVQAIKGIANLAAVSGSNAQQASTAMYQLSQALAAGTVKLMDWNSVVNAGMGGQVFQDALKETARVHGIAIDDMIKKEGSFRETLKDGWLTSEILTETLNKFTGNMTEADLLAKGYTKAQAAEILKLGTMANDAATKVKTFTQLVDTLKEAAQSGWTQTWEIMLGDFEEAKEMYTNISNVLGDFIGKSSDARNSILQGWKDLGGRTDVITAVTNAFNALIAVLKPVQDAFRDIFPRTTSEQLKTFTSNLVVFSEKLKIGAETSDKLKRTFEGLFAVIDIIVSGISAIVKGFASLLGVVLPVGDGVLGITATFGDYLVMLRDAIKSTDVFNNTVGAIVGILKPIINVLSSFAKAIGDTFLELGSVTETTISKTQTRFAPLEKAVQAVTTVFKNLRTELSKLTPLLEKVMDVFGYFGQKIKQVIDNTFNNMEIGNIFDVINTAFAGAGLLELRKFLTSARGSFDGITDLLDGVKGSLEAWQMSIKAPVIRNIAISIGILAGSLTLLAMIDSNKLTSALAAMTVVIVQLFGALAMFDKLMKAGGLKSAANLVIISGGLIALSTAILILSSAVKQLGDLNFKELAVGLTGVAGLISMLVGSSIALEKTGAKMIKGSVGLVIFAAAIGVLANTVTKLAALDLAGLTKGLIGVGALLTGISIFLNTTNIDGMSMLKGAGILLLAQGVSILATAAGKFAVLDIGSLTKGLIGVGAVLTQVAMFVNSTGDTSKVISTAIGLTILAGAMNLFASAVTTFGNLPIANLAIGLAGMGGALAIVQVALSAMPKNIIGTGIGLTVVATALVILSKALETLGGMSISEIGKSLIALGGALTILAVALNAMTGTLPASAAILVASVALGVLAPVLRSLGSMSIAEIGVALIALAGSFTIIGGAAVLLAPLTPAILALSVGLLALSAAVAITGAGMAAFATGITMLANSGQNVIELFKSMLALIPELFTQIGNGLVELAGVITRGAPAIIDAVMAMIVGVIAGIADNTPKILDSIGKMLSSMLKFMVDNVPKFVKAGFEILVAFLKGIRDNITKVVETAIEIVVNFLNAVANKLPEVIQAGFNLIIAFVDGLTKAIDINTPRLITSIQNLFRAIVEAALRILVASVTSFLKVGSDIMKSGLIQGWKSNISDFTSSVSEACSKGVRAIQDRVSDFASAGKNLINGFIGGIRSKISEAADSAANMANSALKSAKNALGIHSPSREFIKIGKYICEGLSGGLNKYSSQVNTTSERLAGTVLGVYNNILSSLDTDHTLRPTISPVVNMDDALGKLKTLNDLSMDTTISASIPEIKTSGNPIEFMLEKFGSIEKAITALENVLNSITDTNNITIQEMNVREETDIRKIAVELYNLQRISSRGRGVLV